MRDDEKLMELSFSFDPINKHVGKHPDKQLLARKRITKKNFKKQQKNLQKLSSRGTPPPYIGSELCSNVTCSERTINIDIVFVSTLNVFVFPPPPFFFLRNIIIVVVSGRQRIKRVFIFVFFSTELCLRKKNCRRQVPTPNPAPLYVYLQRCHDRRRNIYLPSCANNIR